MTHINVTDRRDRNVMDRNVTHINVMERSDRYVTGRNVTEVTERNKTEVTPRNVTNRIHTAFTGGRYPYEMHQTRGTYFSILW